MCERERRLEPQFADQQLKDALRCTVVNEIFDTALVIAESGNKMVKVVFAKGPIYKGRELPEKEIQMLVRALEDSRDFLEELKAKEVEGKTVKLDG